MPAITTSRTLSKRAGKSRSPSRSHSETVRIWRNVLEGTGIAELSRVADLCPGDDPKVEWALDDAGFRGNLLAVDASKARLEQLREAMGEVSFGFTPAPSLLESASLDGCHSLVGNHIVDDLLVSAYAGKEGRSYDSVYSRSREDPDYSRKVWREISSDSAVREYVVRLLTDTILSLPESSGVVFSHYPSKYERVNAMHEETSCCVDTLSEVSSNLFASGEFLPVNWMQQLLNGSRIHRPEHWLVMKRARFQAVEVQITDRCNLFCTHCCAAPLARKNHSSLPALSVVADRLTFGGAKIGFTGGEPFLHPKLEEILHLFAGRGARLSVTTNGTIPRPDLFETFRVLNVKVKVSIHGLPSHHDAVVNRPNAFRRAMNTIRSLVANDIKVAIQTSISNMVPHGPRTLAALCRIAGVHEIKVFPLIDQGAAREHSLAKKHRFCEAEFDSYVDGIREWADRDSYALNVRPMKWPNGGQYVLVKLNGDVSANPVDNPEGSLAFGNVFTHGPDELWDAYPFKAAHLQKYLSSYVCP